MHTAAFMNVWASDRVCADVRVGVGGWVLRETGRHPALRGETRDRGMAMRRTRVNTREHAEIDMSGCRGEVGMRWAACLTMASKYLGHTGD